MPTRKKLYNLAGIILLTISTYAVLSNLILISTATETSGVVTGHETGAGGAIPSRGSVHYPIVEFECCDNRTIVFTGAPGTDPPTFAAGETVQVLFDEATPEDAKIYSFSSMWLLPLTGLGFGVLFISGIFH